ncbi:substrate-binding domain-containing protein [Nocardia sp. alder85J]|uniref:substrate-binding domain-containing protein n=1 Tax=Nocardia sp. alder85J TaxID=2862949 RepID=UPI001CD76D73|nr:substrate-binding domain-containing protein [Nocardia sp. alder85J]MCX4097349.1 substrate-binding domain-containing protein [Nocardia sp. alder85J]
MDNSLLGVIVAVAGVVVPVGIFFWDSVVRGLKRLGYRVQMDTPVTGEVESRYSGVLTQLRPAAAAGGKSPKLGDLSIVLIRMENSGFTTIDTSDYKVPDNDPVGLHIGFPRRRVIGMAVTELSDPGLQQSLGRDSGIGTREDEQRDTGYIDLPRVPLNRGEHYKVLAILERISGDRHYPPPVVSGGLKGGSLHETRSRTGPSGPALGLVVFLIAVIVAEVTFFRPARPPLDCASGRITVTGSTAFAPVLADVAQSYQHTCGKATFGFDPQSSGSDAGLTSLNEAGTRSGQTPPIIAFSDGEKRSGFPDLLARPIAFVLFAVVVNPKARVLDLTRAQLQDLYAGRITNWSELGGADLPVRLVSRQLGSGTRTTFESRVLGAVEAGVNSKDCETVYNKAIPGPPHCEQLTTDKLLDTVAASDGAIGYSELGTATLRSKDVAVVRIDGQPADREHALHNAYPYWETEYAYTYGEPKADSLIASFLRYLTDQVGIDIIRSHGDLPCSELDNPVLCHPAQP